MIENKQGMDKEIKTKRHLKKQTNEGAKKQTNKQKKLHQFL